MGSKIVVGSYVHLRREGLEGYIESFNEMVSEIHGVTGDTGIEVLLFVPVVFEGIDDVGKELICGVQEWVRWIGRKSGRTEFEKLSETGGMEVDSEGGGSLFFWRPSFMIQHGRQGGLVTLLARGNKLTLLNGERMESRFDKAMPAKEIERMSGIAKGRVEEQEELDDEGQERESFEGGVSVEGELAFTKALGDFCRRAVGGTVQGKLPFQLEGADGAEGQSN
jgi:hypothetical protein